MNRFLKKHWGKIALAVIGIPVVGYFVLCLSIGVGGMKNWRPPAGIDG